jgi:transcriptional regulator with XRE-family HTH domain
MSGFTYKSYNFVDKDPIIDYIRTVIRDSGMKLKNISLESGVSYYTINSWLYGKTKRPQAASINAVLRACNYQLSITTLGAPSIIRPTPYEPQAYEVSDKTVLHMRKYHNLRKKKGKNKLRV